MKVPTLERRFEIHRSFIRIHFKFDDPEGRSRDLEKISSATYLTGGVHSKIDFLVFCNYSHGKRIGNIRIKQKSEKSYQQ